MCFDSGLDNDLVVLKLECTIDRPDLIDDCVLVDEIVEVRSIVDIELSCIVQILQELLKTLPYAV